MKQTDDDSIKKHVKDFEMLEHAHNLYYEFYKNLRDDPFLSAKIGKNGSKGYSSYYWYFLEQCYTKGDS
tara:strand:+ start:732 stop:938 length:207 start_codon:yes stop_codon:yes gene_type:complete